MIASCRSKGLSMAAWLTTIEHTFGAAQLAAIYEVFAEVRIPPGIFRLRLDQLCDGNVHGLPLGISDTYRRLAELLFEHAGIEAPENFVVECWSNKNHKVDAARVEYHVDNDEDLRRRTGIVRTPLCGLILYVGPDDGEIGGTYFNVPACWSKDRRLFQRPRFDEVFNDLGMLIQFQPGRVVVFDGRCPHCVVPYEYISRPRVTLLCNAWQISTPEEATAC
jgi:hypothetical protein